MTTGGIKITHDGKRGIMYYFNCGAGNNSHREAATKGTRIKDNLPTYLAEKKQRGQLDFWEENAGG